MNKNSYKVKEIKWLMDKAGRLDWAANPDGLIAFDSRGSDGFYDVFVATPDGSYRTCLTCNKADKIPQKHNGNPAWHPSGRFIVFQSENLNHIGSSDAATPGAGIFCDLWLMSSDGKKFFRLTEIESDTGQASLHPHFSHDGSTLFWTERVGGASPPGTIGEWALKIADFSLQEEPHVSKIRTLQPGTRKMWHESHGFSPDNNKILFSGDLEENCQFDGMDLYSLDLKMNNLINLTSNRKTWDEHGHFSPDGEKIVWISSRDNPRGSLPGVQYMRWLATDLWIMNSDGSDKRKLTHFNETNHPEYVNGRAIVADGDWSKDGNMYAVLVNILKPGSWEEWIAVVEFK
ncbi:MAG: TolB family protein [Candidatus Thorarchaeota archaeon]